MSQFKAKIDYTQEQDADLIPIGTTIHDGMTAAAATFTAPPVTMANFQAHITDYNDKLGKAQNRGTNEVAAKNAARLVLEGDLRNLGHYVNVVSNGDRAKVDLSGFPGYDSRHSRSLDKGMVSNVSFLPQNLRLSQGNGSGIIKCQWESDGSGTGCEVQTTTGDPNNDAGWSYKGSFSGGKCEIAGFSPGNTVWARVRKIGRHGETGPFSDPAKIMVT